MQWSFHIRVGFLPYFGDRKILDALQLREMVAIFRWYLNKIARKINYDVNDGAHASYNGMRNQWVFLSHFPLSMVHMIWCACDSPIKEIKFQ